MRGRRTLGASVLVIVLGLFGLILLGQPSAVAESNSDTVHLVEPNGRWHLWDQAIHTFWYGVPGDVPLLGDWNGDGFDTPGVWRQGPGGGLAFLTNSLPGNGQVGVADFTFYFGNPGDQVFVGDWNGDGIDTLGVSRAGHIFLTNTNGSEGQPVPTHYDFWFGTPGDRPFGGDPDGNNADSLFLYRPSDGYTYYTNQTPVGPNAVATTADFFSWVGASARRVAGDWDGDGIDTAGAFMPGLNTVLLTNTNPSGGATAHIDDGYIWGEFEWMPVAGWTGVNAPPTTTTTLLP